MWLLFGVAILVLLAVIGGAFAGGVYTIVLIPLAVLALISAIVYGYFSGAAQRAAERGGGGRSRPAAPPTAQQAGSSTRPGTTGTAPGTPEELADARRANQ